MWFKMKNRGATGVYQHRVQLFEQMTLSNSDIVFLGNSITEQGAWSELLDNPSVKNRGIAGDMTDGILRRLKAITQAQPAQIFLMIGVNDLILRSPQQIIENYRKIVQQILTESPNTNLVLQSILPVNNEVKNTGIQNKDIQTINRAIEELAREKQLAYLKINDLLQDANGNLQDQYTADGIHLNAAAYQIWIKALKKLLLQ